MARWFDDAAKSAASREVAGIPPRGVTRRTALKRGAVVAGVAWTAPVLMQTRAYAGASMCAAGTVVCSGTLGNTTVACCAPGEVCNTSNAGVPTCAPPEQPGGTCGNQGVGQCTLSDCNGNFEQCNKCVKPNICGGEAALCNGGGNLICAPGLECTAVGASADSSTGMHCRRPCSLGCSAGQVCSQGYCAELCTKDSDCQGVQQCVTVSGVKVCNYSQK